MDLNARPGVAVWELVTAAGTADYALFVNRRAVGAIETKKQGATLSGGVANGEVRHAHP